MTPPGAIRRFLGTLGLMVLTLGLFIPYWLYRRNEDVRAIAADDKMRGNAWFLSVGAGTAAVGRLLWGRLTPEPTGTEGLATAASFLGLTVFLVGVHILARNAADVADDFRTLNHVPPWIVTVGLAAGWVAVELGNVFASWFVRGPAIVLLLAQPYILYRLHVELEEIEQNAVKTSRRVSPAPLARHAS